MKNEVVLKFDVNVDPIADAISEEAEKQLIERLIECAEAMVFTHRGSYCGYRQRVDRETRNGLQDGMIDILVKFMEDNKEEIIDRAAQNLAKRLAMSKQGKAILGDLEEK